MDCLLCDSNGTKFAGGCVFGCHVQYWCKECNHMSFYTREHNRLCPDWVAKLYIGWDNTTITNKEEC